jgi:hypothetical protein
MHSVIFSILRDRKIVRTHVAYSIMFGPQNIQSGETVDVRTRLIG